MSLSRNEINTIKKAVKEAIEVYVDIKIANAQYAFTEIATVTKENWDDLSNDIKVKGKATYTHVISVGKIVYPVGSVVYCFVPNNQYNNMFILGKLDKVPAQITGGTIGIGRIGTSEPPQYNFYVDSDGNVTITKGSINLGKNGNSYNFSVDNNGNVSMSKGSINLGNGNFVVDNQGNTTIKNGDINITSGNLHIGWNSNYNDYNFAVENDGSVRAYDGSFYGHVSASSGNFGKFRINATDGLLDYEDSSNNHYVYLGRGNANNCGIYVSDRSLSSHGGNYVSIAPYGIEISDGSTAITESGGGTSWTNYNYPSQSCYIDYQGIDLSHGGRISFGSNKYLNGITNNGVYDTDFDIHPELENDIPSVRCVKTTAHQAYSSAVSASYDEISRTRGVTVSDDGNSTLSTGGTDTLYMSVSSKGRTSSTYGHHLKLPSSGTSSDIRLKEQIDDMPNIEDVYNSIKLHKFKYHNDIVDTLPTYHWGVIAQELEDNLKKHGYEEDDYSIVFKGIQNSGYNEDKYVGDDKVYRLWSSDFDAMHIQMIQKLWKRCNKLEEEIKELKERKSN